VRLTVYMLCFSHLHTTILPPLGFICFAFSQAPPATIASVSTEVTTSYQYGHYQTGGYRKEASEYLYSRESSVIYTTYFTPERIYIQETRGGDFIAPPKTTPNRARTVANIGMILPSTPTPPRNVSADLAYAYLPPCCEDLQRVLGTMCVMLLVTLIILLCCAPLVLLPVPTEGSARDMLGRRQTGPTNISVLGHLVGTGSGGGIKLLRCMWHSLPVVFIQRECARLISVPVYIRRYLLRRIYFCERIAGCTTWQ
jgi:hypothetical protein